jgi:hypothetical protein
VKPTMNLRFVERSTTIPHEKVKDVSYIKTIKVLQQQFEETDKSTGEIKSEWQDVPLVTEE